MSDRPVHSSSLDRVITRAIASLIAAGGLLGAAAGCDPPPAQQGAPEATQQIDSPLYQSNNTPWYVGYVPVCSNSSNQDLLSQARGLIANSWTRAANLTFPDWKSCNGRTSMLEIQFQHGILGHSDYGQPPFNTNTITKLIDDDTTPLQQHFRYEVIHEFGHALDFWHEQERPDNWDSNGNWINCGDLDNGQRAHTGGIYRTSTYDKDSIMNYCAGWRTALSAGDKEGVRRLYGAQPAMPLSQKSSGMCIHPQGGALIPGNNTNAVLWSSCSYEPRLQLQFMADGHIRHMASGKCLHPLGGSTSPGEDTNLVFYDGCTSPASRFEVTAGGSIRHVSSGKCVHPKGGSATPTDGTEIVLHSGCDEDRLKFVSVLAPSARIAHVGDYPNRSNNGSLGLCIHPDGGSSNPDNGKAAVLWDDCTDQDRINFKLRADGSIEQVSSGKCLNPEGGSSNPGNGTRLVFWDTCGLDRVKFEVTPRGSIRHVSSGRCINPRGGSSQPSQGTELVLDDTCDLDRVRFASVPTF